MFRTRNQRIFIFITTIAMPSAFAADPTLNRGNNSGGISADSLILQNQIKGQRDALNRENARIRAQADAKLAADQKAAREAAAAAREAAPAKRLDIAKRIIGEEQAKIVSGFGNPEIPDSAARSGFFTTLTSATMTTTPTEAQPAQPIRLKGPGDLSAYYSQMGGSATSLANVVTEPVIQKLRDAEERPPTQAIRVNGFDVNDFRTLAMAAERTPGLTVQDFARPSIGKAIQGLANVERQATLDSQGISVAPSDKAAHEPQPAETKTPATLKNYVAPAMALKNLSEQTTQFSNFAKNIADQESKELEKDLKNIDKKLAEDLAAAKKAADAAKSGTGGGGGGNDQQPQTAGGGGGGGGAGGGGDSKGGGGAGAGGREIATLGDLPAFQPPGPGPGADDLSYFGDQYGINNNPGKPGGGGKISPEKYAPPQIAEMPKFAYQSGLGSNGGVTGPVSNFFDSKAGAGTGISGGPSAAQNDNAGDGAGGANGAAGMSGGGKGAENLSGGVFDGVNPGFEPGDPPLNAEKTVAFGEGGGGQSEGGDLIGLAKKDGDGAPGAAGGGPMPALQLAANAPVNPKDPRQAKHILFYMGYLRREPCRDYRAAKIGICSNLKPAVARGPQLAAAQPAADRAPASLKVPVLDKARAASRTRK